MKQRRFAVVLMLGLTSQAHTARAAPPADPPDTAGSLLSLADAVRSTLERHPRIQGAAVELDVRRAELTAARGPFDTVLTAGVSHIHDASPVVGASPPPLATVTTNTTDLDLAATKTTRFGLRIEPSLALRRQTIGADGIAYSRIGGSPVDTARLGLTLTQPLLRGAGYRGAASALVAADLTREAAELQVIQAAEEQVFETIVAYYRLVAAGQELGLLRAIEATAAQVVEDTKALVAADHRPRSDLRQVEANLANRTRAVLEADNDRWQAIYALVLAMGLDVNGVAPFVPTDGLPAATVAPLDRAASIEKALRDRADLRAARRAVAATEADLRGAQQNRAPALDVRASVGYAGARDEDGGGAFFASAASHVHGLDAGVALNFELPVANSARAAEHDRQRALLTGASLVEWDLRRTAPLAVASALDDLRLSRSTVAVAAEAVADLQRVVMDQRDRLHEGAGTIIDIIVTEEMLITAQQRLTADQLREAVALARVWFETGALPTREADVGLTLPRLLAAAAAGRREAADAQR